MKPEDFGIKKYYWKNGLLNVDQSVDINNKKLTEIPFPFGAVKGHFDCSENQLVSLVGCPREIGDTFRCVKNKIKTIDDFPENRLNHLILANNKDLTEISDEILLKIKGNLVIYKTSIFFINPKFNTRIDHYEDSLFIGVLTPKEFNQMHVSKRIKQRLSVSF